MGGGWRADVDLVPLNFVNADIEGVVRAVSEITGKNFVLDPRVKGTVNIVSARPMSRAHVYEVFLSALRVQGFAAIEDRGIVKIVPESEAKLPSSPTLGPPHPPPAPGGGIGSPPPPGGGGGGGGGEPPRPGLFRSRRVGGP